MEILLTMSITKAERVSVYIDGFNLYHALDDLRRPPLKWLNLAKLARYLIKPQSQRIVSVKYFSAFANHYSNTPSVDKLVRHRAYVAALDSKGVECHMGNFAKRDRVYTGRGYKARWRRYEEKQTDVGIGVHLIHDAHVDHFDRALVISLDTDLLPAFRLLKNHFPSKRLVSVAPPQRPHHRDIQAAVDETAVIKVSQLEKSLFGPTVVANKNVIVRRLKSYKP